MARFKQIKSGTIIRVKLELDLGYVYGKVINLVELLKTKQHVDELVHFFNFVTDHPSHDDLENIQGKDLLVAPLFVLDLKPVLKNKTWEEVGFIQPTKEELIIPDFKEARPITASHEEQATGWNYIRNLEVNGRTKSSWEKVKHLDKFQYLSHDLITRRLTMEYLRQIGKNAEDYYDLKEWRNMTVYRNMKFTEIYSTVPKEIRGRAIE